jgi:uroporphyrinogen decarboxylase
MLYDQPAALHLLFDKLAMAVTAYLNAQIAAGVHVVMIFDTWGGLLAPQAYQEFSLRYAQHVRAGLRHEREGRRIPVIFFTKGGGQWLETMADAGFDAIGLDWTTDLGLARARVGDRVALQGNLDPAVLYARPEVIREQVRAVLDAFGPGNGHVFNLGHGITPDVHPEHLGVLIDAVHALSPGFHCAD